jgi:hypothetical protein
MSQALRRDSSDSAASILQLEYSHSMHAKPALLLLPAFIGFAVSLSAQFDPDKFVVGLRASFGPPLTREVFSVPVGEMAVDYAANGHACEIRLPGRAPEEGTNVISAKAVDDFLVKLLPLSIRGKELAKILGSEGIVNGVTTQYENVTISEWSNGQTRPGVTATFTKEKCQDRPAQ